MLFVLLVFVIFISGCSQKVDDYNHNLSITNHTDQSLKSITFHAQNESLNLINADDKAIKSGDRVNLNAPYREFKLQVVTDDDREYTSQDFIFDFEENNEPKNISIEKDSTDQLIFIVTE